MIGGCEFPSDRIWRFSIAVAVATGAFSFMSSEWWAKKPALKIFKGGSLVYFAQGDVSRINIYI